MVYWLSQTKRNLTIEYLNFNFVTTPKLTPLHLFYAAKVFFLYLTHSRFASAYMSKPFQYQYFAAYSSGFKVFNQIGTCWYFQLVKKKKCFAWENAKKVAEGLGTGSFIAATNLAPHSCGCGTIFCETFS